MVDVGDVLVWPHHGPVEATSRETRDIKGTTIEYVVLAPVGGGSGELSLVVPVTGLDAAGARPVTDRKTVESLLKTLSDGPTPLSKKQWSAKYKAMLERSGSGDLDGHVLNLRDMATKADDRSLSPAEKRLWDKSIQFLAAEAAIATDSTVEQMTEKVLNGLAKRKADA